VILLFSRSESVSVDKLVLEMLTGFLIKIRSLLILLLASKNTYQLIRTLYKSDSIIN